MVFNIMFILFLCILKYVILLEGKETIDPHSRIDCFPEPGMNQEKCIGRGCIYDSNVQSTVPQCYYPSNTGYNVESSSGKTLTLKKSPTSVKNPYGQDFEELIFSWEEIGAGIHVTISPKGVTRYRPPMPVITNPTIVSQDKLNLIVQNNSTFSFLIQRERNGVNIWDTSLGGLLFADQYLQIAAKLATNKIYGFGENIHQQLQHNLTMYRTWGMFAKDHAPDSKDFNTQNLYGVHPFYMGLEEDGSAHGVFIFNSNAQEVTLGPAPHLVYRTIGGQLEFFFFPGPTPEEVVQQYQAVIGTPYLPAYWALGFQITRYGYGNLGVLQDTINHIMSYGIPLDVVICGIECMHSDLDFTLDTNNFGGFPNYTKWLHAQGMHFKLAFDPAIEVDYYSFQRGIEANVSFIEWPNDSLVPQEINNQYALTNGTKIMLGNVWPKNNVACPDFLDPTNVTNQWWINEFYLFHNNTIQFDGIWIDMNEPSNFYTDIYYIYENGTKIPNNEKNNHLKCPFNGSYSQWDNPPYPTINAYAYGKDSHLCTQTVCLVGTSIRGSEKIYNTKNLYGLSMVRATSEAVKYVTGKRGEVLTRSTFPSSGHYGAHWLGDNTARWEDLRTSIIGIQEFNMFGITHIGADICGYNSNTTEELCLRWQQLGAFYTYSRNHNGHGNSPQDPAEWPSVAQAARKANLFRYRHLPYLFSLMFAASLRSGTVIRPIFFEFPSDNDTHNLSHQFLWGSALMIAPVIYEGATSVDAYIPSGAIWYSVYDYFYGTKMSTGYQTFPAPTNYLIPVFVRGGNVIPRQKPSTTTTASRQNEFQLLIALDQNSNAIGEMFWDDGDSIVLNDDFSKHNYYHFLYKFTVNQQTATLNITKNRDASDLPLQTLDNIEIFGYQYQPDFKSIKLDGVPVNVNTQLSSYSVFTQLLNMTAIGLVDYNKNGPTWILSWNNLS